MSSSSTIISAVSHAQPSSASATTGTTSASSPALPQQQQQAGSVSSSAPGPSTATSVSSPRAPAAPPGTAHGAGRGLVRPRGPGGPPSTGPQPHIQQTLPSQNTQRQVAEARDAVVASISNMLDSELQARAALLHGNNAAIDKQRRDIEKAIPALRKETEKLQKVADDASRRIREIGDVQNWAELLEKDFLQLEETMRLVREGGVDSDSDSGSWTGSGSGNWSGSEAGDAGGREPEQQTQQGEGGAAHEEPVAPPVASDGPMAGDVVMRDGPDDGGGQALGSEGDPAVDKGKGREGSSSTGGAHGGSGSTSGAHGGGSSIGGAHGAR